MKRKVGLFLLAVMVAVSLGAIIVTSLAMYRLASQRYAEEIRKIEASLTRPLRRLPGHAERPARAHHVAHGKGAAGDRAGAGSDGPGARRSLESTS